MDVFVYGTLTNPATVSSVVDSYVFVGPATLSGLHLVDARYPTLAPGGKTAGRLLRTPAIDALDEYEGVDSGLYVRVSVPLAHDGTLNLDERAQDDGDAVAVYVGDPAALGADVSWPGNGSFTARVEDYLEGNEVVVRSGHPG